LTHYIIFRVSEFEASQYKVTNEEFLQFVRAKGYENPSYWSEEGWRWVQFRQAKHPPFWICPDNCKCACAASLKDYAHCRPSHFTQTEKDLFQTENCNSNTNGPVSETFRPEFPYKLIRNKLTRIELLVKIDLIFMI